MKKYLIVIICIVFCASCISISNSEYKYRNTIHFKDSVEEVEANILKLNSLLEKIRLGYNDTVYIRYSWNHRDTNFLKICDSIINLAELKTTNDLFIEHLSN
ncbi:MAG TPA: hypothetical protein PLL02_06310, partial [Bacteroidales bacterium]|nr:hypothetical protein [Bacteroidales bacterium]